MSKTSQLSLSKAKNSFSFPKFAQVGLVVRQKTNKMSESPRASHKDKIIITTEDVYTFPTYVCLTVEERGVRGLICACV